MKIRFQKLHALAQPPHYQTSGAAGADIYACLDEPMDLEPGQTALVPTGFAMALEPGFEAQVRPRSGLAAKQGITVLNSPGTVDSDYRGEVKVILINHGPEPFTINHGERIAQMVIARHEMAEFTEVESLEETGRGTGGFGSTGK